MKSVGPFAGSPRSAADVASPRLHFQSSASFASAGWFVIASAALAAALQTGSGSGCPTHVPAPSQASARVQTAPSSHGAPAVSKAHVGSQQSPAATLPSSHASPAVTTPFPHRVVVQFASQPSPETALPSSHS